MFGGPFDRLLVGGAAVTARAKRHRIINNLRPVWLTGGTIIAVIAVVFALLRLFQWGLA